MHSLPRLSCHRMRADVMAPGELGGSAAHHQPATVSPVDLGDCLGEVRHHQLQGRLIISRAPVSYRADGVSGHGWLLVPVGFARRDGGHHFYFDQEVWPDQAGHHPEHEGRLMGDELAPDFDVGPDILCAG
jgi:hypothetical protein